MRPASPLNAAAIPAAALLAFAPGLFAAARAEDRPEPPRPLPRVRVADDGSRFVLEGSGKTFIPWGFNYVGTFGEIVEEFWATDWPRLEKDFREMRKLGANVVRVHLQLGTYMKSPTEADPAELGRLRRMCDLAAETGLYLDLTGLGCYHLDRVPAWYDPLGEADRWAVQARFWDAVAAACVGHPAVFCYDLMNEPVVGPPKEGEPPWLTGELGGMYFVQRIANDPAGRENAAIAEAWVARLTAAIRAKDPHTPITVGVIPWAQIWPGAKPIFYAPGPAKHLDFVSIHVYPGAGPAELAKAVDAIATYDLGKPIVIEETFPLACPMEDFDTFIERSRERADGWVSHYFGRAIEEHRRGAEPKGTAPDAPFQVTVAAFLEYWRGKGREVADDRPAK